MQHSIVFKDVYKEYFQNYFRFNQLVNDSWSTLLAVCGWTTPLLNDSWTRLLEESRIIKPTGQMHVVVRVLWTTRDQDAWNSRPHGYA